MSHNTVPIPNSSSVGGWGGILQNIATTGSQFLGSFIQAKGAKAAARLAHKQDVQAFRSRYQWMVEDLKAAGLNPILAAELGAGTVAPSPVAQQQGAVGEAIKDSSAKFLAVQQARANVELTKEQSELTRWKTFTEKQLSDKTANESDNIAYDMWRKRASIHEAIEESRLAPSAKRALIAELNARAAGHSARAAIDRAVLPATIIQGSAPAGLLKVINSAAASARALSGR